MIIDFFVLLLTITLVFFILGYWTDNPILSITSAGFLFILGYTLMGVNVGVGEPPGIEFRTGSTIVESGSTTTVTDTFTTESNRTIGFFLEFIAFAAIFLTLLNMWRNREQ